MHALDGIGFPFCITVATYDNGTPTNITQVHPGGATKQPIAAGGAAAGGGAGGGATTNGTAPSTGGTAPIFNPPVIPPVAVNGLN